MIWIAEMVPIPKLIALYSHANIFVCPSVYEPFGIINLEAMACETPVVAAAVGGIPEVVEHEKTGLPAEFDPKGADDAEPKDPEGYAAGLADGMVSRIVPSDAISLALTKNHYLIPYKLDETKTPQDAATDFQQTGQRQHSVG